MPVNMRARTKGRPRPKARSAENGSPKARSAQPRRKDGGEDVPQGSLEEDLKSVLGQGKAEENGRKHIGEWTTIQCPYCGEGFEVHLDTVEDGQTLYEDCHICCKPVVLNIHLEDDDVQISAYRA